MHQFKAHRGRQNQNKEIQLLLKHLTLELLSHKGRDNLLVIDIFNKKHDISI